MENVPSAEARSSLEAIASSRRHLADRLHTPWWYYLTAGILLAQMVVVHGLAGGLWPILSALLTVIVLGRLVAKYSALTGLAPSTWMVVTLAAISLVGTLVLGPIYDRTLRADLRRSVPA